MRNELVTHYIYNSATVKRVINKFNNNDFKIGAYGFTNWTIVDYKSIVYEALIKMVEKYDPNFIIDYVSDQVNEQKNYKSKHAHRVLFEQYISPRLHLAVQGELRELDTLSRYSRDKVDALRDARKLADPELGDAGIIEHIVIPQYVLKKNPAMTREKYYKTALLAEQEAIQIRPMVMSTMHDKFFGDAENVSDNVTNDIVDTDDNIEDAWCKKETLKNLYKIISKFSDIEQYILKYYYGIGLVDEKDIKKLNVIANELGKTEGRISQIKSNLEKKLCDELSKLGIYSF